MPQFEFPFEREAMRGEIPAGLDLIDTGACYRLAGIYKRFYDAGKNEDALHKARTEKEALRRDWEFSCRLIDHHVNMLKSIELAVSKCRKNPTLENAIALCNAIDGLPTIPIEVKNG